MTPEQKTALSLKQNGYTRAQIAKKMGITPRQVKSRLAEAYEWQRTDPSLASVASSLGMSTPSSLRHAWVKSDTVSAFIKNTAQQEDDFKSLIANAIDDYREDLKQPHSAIDNTLGSHLLHIHAADIHFGKNVVESETGYKYSRKIARERTLHAVKDILQKASLLGVGHILFVLGNDILHTDNSLGRTTSGTPQDTDGSIFQMWSDAYACMVDAIKMCAEVAPVSLVHVMSNHDWKMGWTLSQAIAATFADWPTVSASSYNMSENHRKYFRYGDNLLMLSHGDGAKEEKLYALMVHEAREHISQCANYYAVLGHYHHKIRKRRGIAVDTTEKDHIGMTAVMHGNPCDGTPLNIEYVRSPSSPDGWHHRNGYINRQAIECFMYHHNDGQIARFTTWF